ncbi:MAG: MerR family transcriptional regulator [Pseudomonadota bacterium]
MARGSTKSPDAFRTISEAADVLDLPQHVLRFWETRFSQIKPMKRSGGRRYYRPTDIAMLRGIRHLLYEEGYTIKGVQRILREQGVAFVSAQGDDGSPQAAPQVDAPKAPADVQPRTVPADAPSPPPQQAHTGAASTPSHIETASSSHNADTSNISAREPRPAGGTTAMTQDNGGRARLSHADVNALATALRDLIECKNMLDDARPGTTGPSSDGAGADERP